MTDINNSNLPEVDGSVKKEMSKGTKIALGLVLGLLTIAGIVLSGAVNTTGSFPNISQNLRLVLQYLWVGFFLVYIFWFRGIESSKGISMKAGRMTYLIVIAAFLVIILTLNLTGHKLTFSF
jgi:hypothetical protein